MQVKQQQFEPDMEQQTGSKLGKEYVKSVYSQETGKVVWYSHLCKNFPQFVVIHRVKGFSTVSESEVDVFSLIPLLFL